MAMAGKRLGVQFAGQYAGARRDKTSLRNFNPAAGSADSDAIGDLPTLRARSRDLGRNAPIARGARNTSKTNVVGSGLRLSARLQREILGLSDGEAEAWEDYTEVLFDLWASEKTASVDRKTNFYEMQALAFTSAWDSGDCFPLRRYKESTSFLALCVQLIEADRVCTPYDKVQPRPGAPEIRDSVELDADGEAVAYHVLNVACFPPTVIAIAGADEFVRATEEIVATWVGHYNDAAIGHLPAEAVSLDGAVLQGDA